MIGKAAKSAQLGPTALLLSAIVLIAAVFGLGLFSCGVARLGPAAPAPLVVSQDPSVRLGRDVFMTHCYQCHPGGSAGLGPAIINKPLPGFLIKTQIRQGFGAMPGFSEEVISDEELNAVVAYIHAMRAALKASKGH